jgi:two-component system, OmpR family, KDP operon response regulator KdpE
MSAVPLKVLVIDDEPPIRKLLRMGLSTQGCAILEAPNGKTALEQLPQQPDLIILDLGLPDIQGHDLLFNQSISSCTFLLTGRISSDSEGR